MMIMMMIHFPATKTITAIYVSLENISTIFSFSCKHTWHVK